MKAESPSPANQWLQESSPYLLQHAHNPVDWYAWGEKPFKRARRENKPIFLSVGYLTCHWCHVMERESFENEEVARVMNQYFVSIKVDREERPDVDKVFMTYVLVTTGGGGWPMGVWLTPGLKPFLGGTYFPPEDQWGKVGFKTVLSCVAEAWAADRDAIVAAADGAMERLCQAATAIPSASLAPGSEWLDRTYAAFQAAYDPRHGGFSGAPKFPRPATLDFLLRYHARTGTDAALDMSLHTLRAMAEGGMHDQLGHPQLIVIAGKPGSGDTLDLLRTAHTHFIPNKALLLADGGQGQEMLARHYPFISELHPIDGKATAYVCENGVCQFPATDPATLRQQLAKPDGKQVD